MSEQKKSDATGKKTVQVIVGQSVQISLQSMVGSTGYGWYLTRLDNGLALSSAVVTPTAAGIAPVVHQFDFLAIKAGTINVEFQLLAPWRPEEPADTETYVVTITPPKKTAKDDIEAGMAGREFIKASSVNVGQAYVDPSTVVKYAAPMVQAAPSTVMKYAAPMVQSPMPQSLIYAAPMVQSVMPQPIIYAAPMTRAAGQPGTLSAATMIAYAAPVGPSTVAAMANQIDPCLQSQYPQQYAAMMQPYAAPWPNAQLLYAAPMSMTGQWPCPQPMYAAPMVIRYGAPCSQGCC